MKVFTIGLDQKLPPKEEDTLSTSTEKTGPPPSYVSTSGQVPFYGQPAIVIQRKARGYKGVLLVMLTVFLIALFALTISELAYNRQRDENFFKLRWAELKHRIGYGNDPHFSGFGHRALPRDDILPIQPLASKMLSPMASKEKEQQQEIVMTPDPKPTESPRDMEDSSKSSNSIEIEPSGLFSSENVRLNFLRKVLQKIRKNAEQMGFDGTMQISVIEVEPQVDDSDSKGSMERGQPQQQNVFYPHPSPFFVHPFNGALNQPRPFHQPWIEINKMSFGEPGISGMNSPLESQNNEVEERPRQRLPNLWQPMPMNNLNNDFWQRSEFPRPSIQPQSTENPQFLPRFGLWNRPQFPGQNQQQPNVGSERSEVGRRFGDILRDIIANRIQNFQHFATPVTFINPQPQQQQQQAPIMQQGPAQVQFQPFSQQLTDKPQPSESKSVGIDFHNDFFPPTPNQQQINTHDKKSSDEASKPKEFVVSGEISNENNNKNVDESPIGFVRPNPIKIQPDQQGQPQPPKSTDTIQIAPIFGDSDENANKENENEKAKPVVDIWPTSLKTEEQKTQIDKDQNKGNEFPVQNQQQQQAQVPFSQENVPNTAPFFFQVDDPNQAQQQQQQQPRITA